MDMGDWSTGYELSDARNENQRLCAKIEKYEKLLFEMGAMNRPPCFKCGYSGPGYFQPETHPCAKLHHDLSRTG